MDEKIDERKVYVDLARCTGCGACVEACPMRAIRLVDGGRGRYAEVSQSECRDCGVCVEACPEGAILSEDEPAIVGELVQEEGKLVSLGPPQDGNRLLARPVPKALTWLGAALVFAAREIVPRVTVSLLDAWDRRVTRPATPANDSLAVRSGQRSVTSLPGVGGWRHRRRRRGS